MSDLVLYLDVQRAAEATSMSPRWVRQQVRDGLSALDTGGKLLIAVSDLDAWMQSRFKPKTVDLDEAHRIATELTARTRKGAAR